MMRASWPAVLPQGVTPLEVCAWRTCDIGSTDVVNARDAAPALMPAQAHDVVAQEVPLALVFNGISHTVMMVTPTDLEDFALGFGLTEGLLSSPQALYGIEQQETEQGIELLLEVSAACEWRLKERRRTLSGRTGCGLCGTDQLDQVQRALPSVAPLEVSAATLIRAQKQLRDQQTLQQLCGATHAAAWVNLQGDIVCLREDVGRHNALDKLIGALVRQGVSPSHGWICITSRASFEMVQKAAFFGAGVLAAVSAPTDMAVRMAASFNVCLAGFVRDHSLSVYTYPERVGA